MIAESKPMERGARFRWEIARRASADQVSGFGGLNPLLVQLLRNRGIVDPGQARIFLAPDEPASGELGDPFSMAGLQEAVERLSAALASDELIAIYGDYDADGLTATALLCRALAQLGGRLLPFIPHREKDGYGLQDGPLAELRAAGASLVVTVDCGVTAREEIARARAAGLDVIVTDHHLVPAELPAAAVLNPRRPDCGYPFKELAGVGVAFKLAEGLLRTHPDAGAGLLVDDLLQLVAIGTVADIVPLRGENRAMVRRGLARMNEQPLSTSGQHASPSLPLGERGNWPGMQALIAVAGLEPGSIDADRIGYALAPRLNAAGRLDHARLALDLLLAASAEEAGPLAERLNELNRARQALTLEGFERVRAAVAARELGPAIVLGGDFPLGIVGLLAGRLAEEFNRPAIVLRQADGLCVGSARSVRGVNVVEAIGHGAEHLARFGGHAMAAGLTLPTERLAAFEQAFQQAVAAARPGEVQERSIAIDAELRASTAISWPTLELLRKIEPNGAENPTAVFLTRDLEIAERRDVGHASTVRLRFRAPEATLTAIAFGLAESLPPVGERIDLVYRLRRRVRQGMVEPDLEVVDWRSRHDVQGPSSIIPARLP